MQATSRAQAKALGLTTYDTGKPCRKGHFSYRYTQSGVCKMCLYSPKNGDLTSNPTVIHSDNPTITLLSQQLESAKLALQNYLRDTQGESEAKARAQRLAKHEAEQAAKSARVAAKAELIRKNYRIFDNQLSEFKATVISFAMLRCPHLQESDIYPGLNPADPGAGTALYKFNVHPGDAEILLEEAKRLVSLRSFDTKAAIERIYAGIPMDQGDGSSPDDFHQQ